MSDSVNAHVARQAIFSRTLQVHGYELLFRSNAENKFDGTEASMATGQLLANSLLSIGLQNLVGGAQAFVNFGRETLIDGWCRSLPKECAVIEVLETIEPDDEVIAACRKLRAEGYRIALDDYVAKPGYERLLDVADIVKVEIRSVPQEQHAAMVDAYHRRNIKILAEKVETYDEFTWARKAGYDYFQGFFFARPVIYSARQIQASKIHCLRLVREVQQAEINYPELERLIEADVAFTYKLLRHVNSALRGRHREIASIRQALLLLGEIEIRRWVVLAALLSASEDKPNELMMHSMVRARFCQTLAQNVKLAAAPAAFLMGMFSMLDALVDHPLADALAQVNLAPPIVAALTGGSGEEDLLVGIYRLVKSYEAGEWATVDSLSISMGISPGFAGESYREAVGWAAETMRAV